MAFFELPLPIFICCTPSFRGLYPPLLNKNLQDSMGSAGVFVHRCLIDWSAFSTNFDELVQLVLRFNINLSQSIHKDACLRIFSQLQVTALGVLRAQRGRRLTSNRARWRLPCLRSALLVRTSLEQKICDLLHVYFEERHRHSELCLIRILSYVVEYVTDASRNYTALIVQALPCLARVHMI